MDNIINFPTKTVRDKVQIERILSEQFVKTPLAPNDREELLRRCLVLWDKYQHEFQIGYSIPASVNKNDAEIIASSFSESLNHFGNQLKDFNSGIFFERVQAEIKIFLLEKGL